MTKMIKMSLIAAVAVTGITSTVSAQPLEEAIKGVDVSGMLRYRYDDTKVDNTGSAQNNNYRLDVNLKSKVNDTVTANVTVGLANDGKGTNLGGANNTGVAANNNAAADAGAALQVRNANFSANIMGATVIAGKQSVPGPFVDNTVDDVTRGTGAVALVPVGAVTVAAGYFNNTTAAGAINASELALIGEVAGVKADFWYASVDTATTTTAYSLHANGTVAGINVDARYTSKDNNVANADNATLTKIVASGKVGAASLTAGYITTGEDNADNTNNVSVDNDNDSAVDAKVWQASMGKLPDATGLLVAVGMPVADAVSVSATYITVDCDAVNDASELLLQTTYSMSKNFSVHARYSMYDAANVDTTKGRLELKYTF